MIRDAVLYKQNEQYWFLRLREAFAEAPFSAIRHSGNQEARPTAIVVRKSLSPAMVEKLGRLADGNEEELMSFFFSALSALLARYIQQESFILALPAPQNGGGMVFYPVQVPMTK